MERLLTAGKITVGERTAQQATPARREGRAVTFQRPYQRSSGPTNTHTNRSTNAFQRFPTPIPTPVPQPPIPPERWKLPLRPWWPRSLPR